MAGLTVYTSLQGTLQNVLCVRLVYHVVDKHGDLGSRNTTLSEQIELRRPFQPKQQKYDAPEYGFSSEVALA